MSCIPDCPWIPLSNYQSVISSLILMNICQIPFTVGRSLHDSIEISSFRSKCYDVMNCDDNYVINYWKCHQRPHTYENSDIEKSTCYSYSIGHTGRCLRIIRLWSRICWTRSLIWIFNGAFRILRWIICPIIEIDSSKVLIFFVIRIQSDEFTFCTNKVGRILSTLITSTCLSLSFALNMYLLCIKTF